MIYTDDELRAILLDVPEFDADEVENIVAVRRRGREMLANIVRVPQPGRNDVGGG